MEVVMDYEKKYKEALELARDYYKANQKLGKSEENEVLSDIFPELQESEDEKIRKTLIEYFNAYPKDYFGELKKSYILTWLEKQGEQKPILDFNADDWYVSKVDGKIRNIYHSVDKVEPKFKVGDWVVQENIGTYKVIEVCESWYEVIDDQDNRYSIGFDKEYMCHLWSIKDAKDGDVLHSTGWHNDCIFIFKGLDNWKFDEPNGDRAVATGYCCLSVSADNMEFGIQGPDCVEVNTIKPATKIQRDLLFRKMHEAEYAFDFEKKELKKIEPKQEWSEEDEYVINFICERLFSLGATPLSSEIKWLKSLKDRVQPIHEYSDIEKQEMFIRSQRPHFWKPSDKQMHAFEQVYNWYNDNIAPSETFTSLYEDLKKLREGEL